MATSAACADYQSRLSNRNAEAWAVTAERLPGWEWARLSNGQWLGNVFPGVVSAVRAWSPTQGLLLIGPTGCGKTSALVARMHDLRRRAHGAAIDRGESELVPVMWVTEHDLAVALRAHPLGRGECPLVRDAKSAAALVVDEVGPVGRSGPLFEVLNARYQRGLRTVVTSGLTLEQVTSTYGDAMVRRVLNGGRFVDLHEVAR
jgi:DNA replication protein DnaC